MKRVLSILIVLCMALSLCIPALASGGPSGEGSGAALGAAIVVEDGKAALDEEYVAEHGLDLQYESLTDTEVSGLKLDTGDMLVSAVSVTGDDSVFTINDADIHLGVNEETAYVASSGTAGSGALVSSGTLFINDSNIVVDGGANGPEGGHYAVKASGNGTLVVNRSKMIQTGRGGANGLTDNSPEPGSNNGLLIVGFARSSMSVGASQTYYYNSYVETEGWAAMSTDSASGSGLDFYSYNSEAYAVSGGYGIYADSSCRDWLYATTLRGAEHGAIISNNGEVHVYSGDSATADDVLKYYPAGGELTHAGSLIEAGRNCFYIHSPGRLTAFGQQAIVEVADSTLRTSEALNDQQTLRDYAERYSQGVADYLDFIRGSLILVKSHSAKIDLTNVECDSYSDTILMTALNADSSSRYLAVEKEDTPTVLTMTDMDVSGDVKNYDYQRGVEIMLDNTKWSGASLVWEAEDWNAFWDYADGMDSVYWVNLDPETYSTGHHGTTLTLKNGSVWTVTGESKLDILIIEEDCTVICGEAMVDGTPVTLEAGKTYSGEIVLTGEAASNGSSGEASSSEPAAEAEPVPEPAELIEPGIQYFDDATIGGESVGGAFYVYGPEHPHMYDMLSSFLNGTIFVYPDKPVSDEAAALALIQTLGLDENAESFPAYIVIPEPVNGNAWSEADASLFWNIQFWLAGGDITFATEPPQGEYVRHVMNSLLYVLGEGSGATFVNNVLSQNAQRIAGIATFGGEIDDGIPAGLAVPAYLVNASDAAVAYWKAVNGTDFEENGVAYNSAYTQKKVITAKGGDSFDRENVQTAWRDLLSRTMRLGVAVNVVITTRDQSDWVLMDWLQLDDIGLNLHSFEWDAEKGEAAWYDEYMTKSENSVHLYVPEAVEADPGKAVPLVVVLHGMGDDPLNVVVGCGWAQKAVDEGFIMISPATEDTEYVMGLIDYVESLYAIDTSRVYVTGFSMGGANSSNVGKAHPEVFAAIAPMGAAGGSVVDDFDDEAWDLPVCMIVGSIDENNITIDEDGNPMITGIMDMGLASVDQAFAINGIDPGQRDYEKNPFWGYTPDEYRTVIDKDLEWQFSDYYSETYDVPVVEMVTLIGAAHSNADYMATVAWDFLSRFSRRADGSLIVSDGLPSGDMTY